MENGSSSVLHHVEVCVKHDASVLDTLISGFSFRISHFRNYNFATQRVLQSGRSIFVVTKHFLSDSTRNECENISEDVHLDDKAGLGLGSEYPLMLCTCVRQEHALDSVFNVVLEVKDLDLLYKNIKQSNTRIIQDLTTIQDKFGTIRLVTVESKCQNVVHCLIDKSKYFGSFLPGFEEVCNLTYEKLSIQNFNIQKNEELKKLLTNFIDHVSIVCRTGESQSVIDWYQKCFKMKRFFANRDETVEDGFVLEGVIGLRIKALEYWRCAESGITTNPDINGPTTLKIVIVEPLPYVEKGQIADFLVQNDGPGVQHIAFNCKDIVHVVKEVREKGVRFRMPPPTYYDQIDNLNEILENTLKNTYEEFCKSGILLDVEEDLLNAKNKYLLQIFTFSIFEKDTFFLEIIERYGANGFGAGNIKALATSIAMSQEEQLGNKDI